LCDMVCRGLLLMLHGWRDPTSRGPLCTRNPFVKRERPKPMSIDTTPVIAPLKELRPVEVQQVRRTGDEPLFNSLIEHHHYLATNSRWGASEIPGLGAGAAHRLPGMEFGAAIWAAATATSVGVWKLASATSGLIAYNTRFLILPWIRCHTWPRTFSAGGSNAVARLGADVRAPDLVRGDFHRSGALSRYVLPWPRTGSCWDEPPAAARTILPSPEPLDQGSLRLPLRRKFRELLSQ